MSRLVLALWLLAACGREENKVSPFALDLSRCKADLGCTRPILAVRDLSRSLAYYRDVLGFHVEFVDGGDFAAVTRDQATVFLCAGCGQGSPGAWTWTFTRDVDRLHQELGKKKALVREAPADKPWGLREMRVADPDGNVMRFAGPVRR